MSAPIFISPLTPFEQKVFDLSIDGLTVKEMAKETNRSIGNVSFHLVNIHSKAGVESRLKLIAKHYKHELARLTA
jgi:DNA-binding NarL/FixJ family response regulator